mmetsp:Transcript_12255/g.51592  ORF Transcript_12255/g.51592 Transcript_12255/m.51592 type:complete len:243 (+) Transcript_12255:1604-2332(+)
MGHARCVGVQQCSALRQRAVDDPDPAAVRNLPRQRHAAEFPADDRQHLQLALRGDHRPAVAPAAAHVLADSRGLRHGGRREPTRTTALEEPHAPALRLERTAQPGVCLLRLLHRGQSPRAQRFPPVEGAEHFRVPPARRRGGRPRPPGHLVPAGPQHRARHQSAQEPGVAVHVLPRPDRPVHEPPVQQLALPGLPQEPAADLSGTRAVHFAELGRPVADPPHQRAARRGVQCGRPGLEAHVV